MSHEIAIAHNHYPAQGGGEHVANEMARVFGADIYTAWVGDDVEMPADIEIHELIDGVPHEGLIRKYVMPKPMRRNYFYRWLWELTPSLRDKDVIIQSGGFPSYYVPEDDQTIVRYIHSPPRAPFDRFGEITDPIEFRVLLHPRGALGVMYDRINKRLSRKWNKERMTGGGVWVANSDLVKKRIHQYYGVDLDEIHVVYPPVNVHEFTPAESTGDYYLALSRLEPAKRFDVIIEAFHKLNENGEYHLKIAGDGNSREELEELAGDAEYIDFEGYVSEDRKHELLTNAKASVFCAENEDFGIVPIESMAAGTPVIGVRDGFTKMQIQDGKNGVLFDRSPEDLAAAVVGYEDSGVYWSRETMHKFAEQFGHERFAQEMQEVVNTAVASDTVEPEIKTPEVVAND